MVDLLEQLFARRRLSLGNGEKALLTLGTHARGLQYLFCLCVCVFPILAPRAIRRTNNSINDFSAIRA